MFICIYIYRQRGAAISWVAGRYSAAIVSRMKSTSGDSLGAKPFEAASNDQKRIGEDRF